MPFGGRVLRSVAAGQDAQPSAVAPASSAGLFSLTYEPYYGLKEKAFSLSAVRREHQMVPLFVQAPEVDRRSYTKHEHIQRYRVTPIRP